jgi:phosphoribosyl 1,2-cyclic phosphate phosphodiesterase
MLLGTGTSQGVPIIGCDCEVCVSTDPVDKRLRTSALYTENGVSILIDVGPDTRQQLLRAGISHLDAIILTHEHNDHIIGLDEIRPFNHRQKKAMPIYALKRVFDELSKRFNYVFDPEPYPGAPKIEVHEIKPYERFDIKGVSIMPLLIMHGDLPILGFRFENISYITDAKIVPPESLELIKNTPHLVLNALHHVPHNMHLNLTEALDVVKVINPGKTYLTHISHKMGLNEVIQPQLPDGVELGKDGLLIIC